MKKYPIRTLVIGRIDDTDRKFIFTPKYNIKGNIKHYIEIISGDVVTTEIKDKENIFDYYDIGMVDGLKYADMDLIITIYNYINSKNITNNKSR